jgi:hypothetical protein
VKARVGVRVRAVMVPTREVIAVVMTPEQILRYGRLRKAVRRMRTAALVRMAQMRR